MALYEPLPAPIAAAARHAGATLLDLVYPPACLACRRAVAQHGALRPACWRDIAFIERPFCERLGTPFEGDLDQPGMIAPEAAAHPPVFARARPMPRYDSDKARSLVHRLKYHDRLELAGPTGHWMGWAGADILADADPTCADSPAPPAARGPPLQSGHGTRPGRLTPTRRPGRD